MNKPITLSLTGYPGSGKDTLARELIERDTENRWVRLAFADEMKQLFIDLGIPFHRCRREGDEIILESTEMYASTLEELEVWKRDDTCNMRECLQRFGVEIRKRDPDFWVNAVHRKWRLLRNRGCSVVVTDVRFPNEAKWAREAGLLFGIERPGCEAVNAHVSETNTTSLLRGVDWMVVNRRTPEELYGEVQGILMGLDWNHDRN